ncbi:MAG: endonuclease III domain-containing protein [Methanobrevibacter sp.]|uniref:endonuclease III domain-containing protein n=1 Tax=Methanobrevibacter sp. TaxID=66852 RepID=UPI0026DEBE70|nr:endonuclease III domain-containing protein [Methanobrevibacter sp.]MDO5848713.1 endonuclease III domain-containing protein [Methanobrevibacter sp.]
MDKIKENINNIYWTLKENYPHEGHWWPTTDVDAQNIKYGAENSSLEDNRKFEIIMGTILTQNTTWVSVDRALKNLSKYTNFNPEGIIAFIEDDPDLFKRLIKPTGYYNQKTLYLKNIAEFYISLDGKTPSRKEVLSVKGVGNETADSIMLYAYNEKEFVVDAYTRRIFSYLGYVSEKVTYLKLKRLFEDNFEGDVKDYEDYHGLIVEHAKLYYRNRPYGVGDKILSKYKIS